ncbi:MAG: rhomboid family intramembrane serine protease [Myxococcales bacterium]|nr:rhomboid family intramembrane serine protease [Myxococcales bacterium]
MSENRRLRAQMPQGGVNLFGPLTRMVKILLIINFAIYVIELIVFNWMGGGPLARGMLELTLMPKHVFDKLFVWQVGTYAFLHDWRDPMHILMNMFMLWIFGSPLEQRWGPRRFLIFYLVCGVGGGLMTLLLSLLVTLLGVSPSSFFFAAFGPNAIHLGASGAVIGLTAAFALVWSDSQIYMFFVLPMRAKWLIPLELALELLMLLAQRRVSYSAHLGGLLFGILIVTGYWRPRYWLDQWHLWRIRQKHKKKTRSHLSVVKDDEKGRYLH